MDSPDWRDPRVAEQEEEGMTTLIRDLIHVPEEVNKGDFVLKLTEGVAHPEETLRDYVVTPQLVRCFDEALGLIKGAVSARSSKAAFLHGSFGSGKSHFMAVLHLLLQGNAQARGIHDLAPIVAKHASWIQGKKFLLVPYHMIGARSMEQAVLGGYVEYVRRIHPEAPTPAVYLADDLFRDAENMRKQVGDAAFFGGLNKQRSGGSGGWGTLARGWDAKSFAQAVSAPPRSDERGHLLDDLLATYYTSYRAMARAGDGGAFISFEDGLAVLSAHAKSLGYDALILFLDELILWFASHMAEKQFVTGEVQKVVKLVEAANADRPVPLVSFVARQRDLRELVGEHVPGAENLTFADQFRYWEGRFALITLEDRNLPLIAEKRVLAPKSDAARIQIDRDFEVTTKVRKEVMDVLLTSDADREMFRKLYPFSPAFIQALVAVSSALQRERTALKVMVQLLVRQRDTLALGQIVPVGDLFDLISEGDEPFGDGMRRHFENAKSLYQHKLLPLLEETYGVRWEQVRVESGSDPKVRAFRNDDRLVKTLLLSALVPNIEALRAMTASRLAALNQGTIRVMIDGTETQTVLGKVRAWAKRVGEIRISDDPLNPTITVQLTGIDTQTIIDKARVHDNAGNRKLKIRELISSQIGVQLEGKLFHEFPFVWRGGRRVAEVAFVNVREQAADSLRGRGDDWKVVIDFPFDEEGFTPRHDIEKIDEFRGRGDSTKTICWVPTFFHHKTLRDLSTFVILEHILGGQRFDDYASHLPTAEQKPARESLDNQRNALKQTMLAALQAAYGVATPQPEQLDATDAPECNVLSLELSFQPQPPRGADLRAAFLNLLDQAHRHQFPAAPLIDGEDEIKVGAAKKALDEIRRAITDGDAGRIFVQDKPTRDLLRRTAQTLRIAEMGEAHLVLSDHWRAHFDRENAREKSDWTVGNLRKWIDRPKPMGLSPHLQNLIIVAFAERTQRSFFLNGGPYEASLENLPDGVELRELKLPSEEEWKRAASVSGAVFGVGVSQLPSASNLGKLESGVMAAAATVLEPARTLCKELTDRMRRLGIDPAPTPRMLTAQTAQALVEQVLAGGGSSVVTALATFKAPASIEASGTSLRSATDVVGVLRNASWDLLEAASGLTDDRRPGAEAIRDRVREAVSKDELSVAAGLGAVLRAAQTDALRLLAPRTATPPGALPPVVPPTPPVAPPPAPRPGRRRESFVRESLAPTEARVVLDDLRRKVDRDPTARLTIRWDLDTEDGSK
jgi:hypothetical protein